MQLDRIRRTITSCAQKGWEQALSLMAEPVLKKQQICSNDSARNIYVLSQQGTKKDSFRYTLVNKEVKKI